MKDDFELAELFCRHYNADAVATVELGRALADCWRRAAAGWDDAWLSRDEFIAELAAHIEASSELVARVEQMRAPELYLAYACAAGHAGAIAVFETIYMPVVESTVRNMRGQSASVDEVAQQIRERLLTGSAERRARIADYSGRGDLRRWLRAAATRTYLNLMRKHKREIAASDEPVLDMLADGDVGPELAHMKQLYRAEFKEAFGVALAKLSARQIGVLRYRYVEGVTVEELARIYRIHRATAHRWLNEARRALGNGTERELRKRLSLNETEFDSIRRLIQSQIQLSLPRVLVADEND